MAETTQLELVTPARTMMSAEVEMVVIPGSEGLFGVLPRHSAMLANLQRGQLEIYEGGKVINRFMIDGGVADVSGERVIVLAERAENLDKVSAEELDLRAADASEADKDFLMAVKAAI